MKLNKKEEAVALLDQIVKEGVHPDLHTFRALIFGCQRLGDMEGVQSFLATMQQKGIQPDESLQALLPSKVEV